MQKGTRHPRNSHIDCASGPVATQGEPIAVIITAITAMLDSRQSRSSRGGINKLGIIFNLDPHDKPGSHWVGMFIDLKKGHALFFDSYGSRPPKEVRTLMLRLDRYFENKKIKNRLVDHNKLRHQYKNSECGVYSIAFILRMLAGDSFKNINKNKVSDDEINQCRNVYFSKGK